MTPGGGTPRLLILAALALLVVVAVVAPVSAAAPPPAPPPYEETFSSSSAIISNWTYNGYRQNDMCRYSVSYNLGIPAVEEAEGLQKVVCFVPGDKIYAWPDSPTQTTRFSASLGNGQISGQIDTVTNYDLDGHPVALVTVYCFDSPLNVSGLNGRQILTISMDDPIQTYRSQYHQSTYYQLDGISRITGSDYAFAAAGTYEYHYLRSWENTLNISCADDAVDIHLQRHTYKSRFVLRGAVYNYSNVGYSDIALQYRQSNLPLSLAVQNLDGVWYNRSYPQDPAEVPGKDFSLSLSSPETTNYAPVTATLTTAEGAPEWDEIAWIHGDEQRTFQHSGDTWTEFNYESLEYDIPSDEQTALIYQFTAYCPPGGADEDIVLCCLYSEGKQIAELTGRVEIVSGSTKTQLAVVVVDYTDGQTPVLFGADVEVRDEKTKQLQQETGSDETFHRFILEKGRRYIVTADAPGYKSSSRTITATKDVQSTEIYLSKEAPITAPDNSTQIGFVVTDGQYRHVEGALIRLTDQTTGTSLSGLTNQYGALTFLADRTHQYRYAVSKTGYIGVQGAADLTGTTTVRLRAEGDGLGGGDQPGHDSRTIDQKATSALGILFDQVELIAALAGLILVCNMLTWILPGGGRRR
jgi:hypothetical protein